MLVLQLAIGEKLFIGDEIQVMFVEQHGREIRLGITAPRDVAVDRERVRAAKLRDQTPLPKENDDGLEI